MSVEYRRPAAEEFRSTLATTHVAFGEELRDDDVERQQELMPHDRLLSAYEDSRPVGTAAAYPFELTVPGGVLPAAGVTWVGVLPSHRRRGVLTGLMRKQLQDVHERGEPLAILWASESAIYGRFGYGIAAPVMSLEADLARFRFRDDPGPVGAVRLIDADEALRVLPPFYDGVRGARPGMLSRSDGWWRQHKVADPEHWRRGAGPKFIAFLELDGEVAGYAMYRIKSEWEQGIPRGEARVIEVLASSSNAERELWRFLFGIDLVARVDAWLFDPGSPLFLMVVDPRSLHLRISEGLWLRIVDLESALGGRTFAADEPVVLDVRDEFCPWNAGRWRIGPGAGRTHEDADLELDVADLASAYLGAFDFHHLAAAQRVRELRPGALARASALFRTTRPPFCPEIF